MKDGCWKQSMLKLFRGAPCTSLNLQSTDKPTETKQFPIRARQPLRTPAAFRLLGIGLQISPLNPAPRGSNFANPDLLFYEGNLQSSQCRALCRAGLAPPQSGSQFLLPKWMPAFQNIVKKLTNKKNKKVYCRLP